LEEHSKVQEAMYLEWEAINSSGCYERDNVAEKGGEAWRKRDSHWKVQISKVLVLRELQLYVYLHTSKAQLKHSSSWSNT
jgi:hypothetical protein